MLIPNKAKAQSDDDKKFLATAAQGDQNEIALSEAAEQKATNPAVKAFAEKMVKEHKQMTESMKPFAEQWGSDSSDGTGQRSPEGTGQTERALRRGLRQGVHGPDGDATTRRR